MAKLLRTALEVIWVHEQTIGDLIDLTATVDNFVKLNAPEFYDGFQKIREQIVHQSYAQHLSKLEDVERAMANAKQLVEELEHS